MNRLSRRLLNRASTVFVAWIVGVGGFTTCSAGLIQFDPDGSGGANSAVTIGGLDWSVGNALAVGGNQAVANFLAGSGSTTFELDYQAVLAGYIDTSGNTTAPSGLNTAFEITVAAKFFETVSDVSVSGSLATASFTQAANQTGGFFEIWYDTSPNASNLDGTGFRDGTRILSGNVSGASGNFTVTNTNGSVRFDQFGPNNYGDQLTVSGIGASEASFQVTAGDFDPAFFLSTIISVAFNTTNSLPFVATNPSREFFGYTPSLGAINGALGASGGPDVQFQADGNNSFAVPEPSSVVMVALGVAGVFGYDLRRRRNVRTVA